MKASYKPVRFEILTAVKMSMSFFWAVTPCDLIGRYQCSIFKADAGDSMFVQNAGIYMQVHKASQPRRTISTSQEPFHLKPSFY
jgi:hypothetical protein